MLVLNKRVSDLQSVLQSSFIRDPTTFITSFINEIVLNYLDILSGFQRKQNVSQHATNRIKILVLSGT